MGWDVENLWVVRYEGMSEKKGKVKHSVQMRVGISFIFCGHGCLLLF